MTPAEQYLSHCRTLLDAVVAQTSQIAQAADWFAASILAGRMVHVFGSGHSRIMVEEMWPRYGSFPGFNPIVELSLTFHNNVVGANGQRQAMFLENVPGLAARILRNFDVNSQDAALVISSSGCNVVPVEFAELCRDKGMKVVVIVSKRHSIASTSRHPRGVTLSTFAHEMGHAVHTEQSKTQRPLYQGYSTATAETASTFFENVVFDAELATLSDKEKIVALHDKINDDIASIFRQVAFFNFEKELHERVRAEGALTKEELAKLFQKHLRAYLGPKVKVTKDDGYGFVYISHFRNFFYVYTYAYGNVISAFLAKRLREDPAFIEDIDRFLTAGSSKSPEDIFKDIGVDTSKPAFFTAGMQMLDDRITELENLVKKR